MLDRGLREPQSTSGLRRAMACSGCGCVTRAGQSRSPFPVSLVAA
jgi:hypothetical protein